ncbi:MAG: hypothetical protein KAJ39_05030 [Gammaproteobacteria bacterium]|nr:hypothetical protein [Gammaproteobacteria bacterium]
MRQEIIIEDAFRTDDVVGAIVTAMGIVLREKDGGLSGFIETDDEKGLITYNLTVKGEVAGIPDSKDISKWIIPGYLDFSKVNKAFREHGYVPYIDLENNSWETEPPLIGKKVWINRIKTSTGADGKEYFSHIKVTKIEDGESPTQPPQQPPQKEQAGSSDELKEKWINILNDVLTGGPLNEIEINTAVRKAFPNDATIRKQLADVRKATLTALVNDGVLELTDGGKYQLAV